MYFFFKNYSANKQELQIVRYDPHRDEFPVFFPHASCPKCSHSVPQQLWQLKIRREMMNKVKKRTSMGSRV
jgi:hypothetical protein